MASSKRGSRSAHRLIALLRGVNVGKAKRVPMADLRQVFETLGFENVATILNSGNVVFTSQSGIAKSMTSRIERAIVTTLNVESRVTLLTVEQLEVMLEFPPPRESTDPSRRLFAVPRNDTAWTAIENTADQNWSPEAIRLGKDFALLHLPEGVLKSRLVPAIEKATRLDVTMRNAATMAKILAKARPE
ncbi:MAG: DUF1697 domain-containing protein [Planctomycetes bacterium]|nr:DUF1697 domain-containing protein [Planctomycetota bacterium]